MELWAGNVTEFVRDASGQGLALAIWDTFRRSRGHEPSQAETTSWQRSLSALAKCLAPLREKDIGVICEYHLQFSQRRIDAVLLGRAEGSQDTAAIVELKQWASVELPDDASLNIRIADKEALHPSEQALNYKLTLEDTHSAFVKLGMRGASSAYCHDMSPRASRILRSPRFSNLLYNSPLFDHSEEASLREFIDARVGRGGGRQCLEAFRTGHFSPSPRLLDVLEQTINADRRWTLIDSQQVAYNAIWAQISATLKTGVQDASAHSRSQIFIVCGGPGTGKTVIAVRLLRDALKNGLSAVHSTGGKAFTINMQGAFEGAKSLFVWNMSLRNAPYKGIDLLLVDEAHRLRRTSDTRFTPAAEQNRRSQLEELIDASRLTVFFVDDNQNVRPDEIGSTKLIEAEAKRLNRPTKSYDLIEQFRCGGCEQYVEWVDKLLGFADDDPRAWGRSYSLRFADSPEELEQRIRAADAEGRSARLVAGFCWKWSSPDRDGTLVPDVEIGGWKMPWNVKAKANKQYRPAEHPYTQWARAKSGIDQVGCIYSAQGFEFDVVGVIWGKDLVWRDGKWVAQRAESRDTPVRARNADSLRLFQNAYRVLLTRGMKETHVLCVDAETRKHLEASVTGLQQGETRIGDPG